MRTKKTFIKNKKTIPITLIAVIFLSVSILILCRHEAKEKRPADVSAANSAKTESGDNTVTTTIDSSMINLSYDPASIANQEIPILMYHYIRDYDNADDPTGVGLSISPTKFSQQLDQIVAAGYTSINFYDLQNNDLPGKPIILTFDDGYVDFYTNAYPELKKRNMTAVVYVIASKNSAQYLTTDMIKELADNNIEIGSHTISHKDLTKLTAEKAKEEIAESKSELEQVTKKTIISFCYPTGKYNVDTEKMVRGAGYLFATTTTSGIGHFSDTYALSRYRISPTTNIAGYLK